MDPNIECFDIDTKVKDIKTNVFTKKNLLSSFFKNNKLITTADGESVSVNNWIAKRIIKLETLNTDIDKYVYWVAGGLSWNNWWQDDENNYNYYTRDEQISMLVGNYDIRYIYYNTAELLITRKIEEIYNIVLELQALLSSTGIETTIIPTNFSYDPTKANKIKEENKTLNKRSYNIKLVIETFPELRGGATAPKKKPIQHSYNTARILNRLVTTQKSELPVTIDQYNKYREELLNKAVVEFNFELFKQSEVSKVRQATDLFSIDLFKRNYLNIASVGYSDGDSYSIIEEKLNKLNKKGLLTYSYLNTSDRVQNLGLNVDVYRQTMFMEKELKNDSKKISDYFKLILNTYYNVFKNTNFFNIFFIEKIEQIIYKYSANMYEEFVDYIERWLMSMFRPAINSFIVEMNKDLEPYNIVLFIAGGDAMRRFNYDISSTKDIDTKLYIKNIKDLSGSPLSYDELKKEVIEIIAKNIVKLRNYLEITFSGLFKNKTIVFDENGNQVIKEVNYSDTPIVFTNTIKIEKKQKVNDRTITTYDVKKETFNIKFVAKPEENTQHFRVREIKKSDKFPVDLYSIDYKTVIKKITSNGSTKDIILNISLLDVVLQEDDFNPNFFTIVDNNIPIASLTFLAYDLQTTYTTEERGIARIASGKYKKDITRYKTLCSMTNDDLLKPLPNYNFTSIKKLVKERLSDYDDVNIKFYIILYKLENNITFNIFDVIICIELLDYLPVIYDGTSEYNQIRKLIEDIAYFKVNIYNEQLNTILPDYSDYNILTDTNIINKNYLQLFRKLIFTDDGQQKHYVSFTNLGITRLINANAPAGSEKVKVSRVQQAIAKATSAKPAKAPKATSAKATKAAKATSAKPVVTKVTRSSAKK